MPTDTLAGGDSFADLDFGDGRAAAPPAPPAVPSRPEPEPPLTFLDPVSAGAEFDFGGSLAAREEQIFEASMPEEPAAAPEPSAGRGGGELSGLSVEEIAAPPDAAAAEIDRLFERPPPREAPLPLARLAPRAPDEQAETTSGLELAVDPRSGAGAPAPGNSPAPAERPQPMAAVPIGRTRPPARRPQRRSTRLLRLVSSVAVLFTALAGFTVVRNGGRLPLDLPALLETFGLGEIAGGSGLVAESIRTGRFPAAGGELFFVRGVVRSRAGESRGPAVRVVAELRAGDEVVARGVSYAGGEPGPEQVAALGGAEEWEALGERLGAGWAAPIAPGESQPFFVVLPAPERSEGLRLRVTATPVGKPAVRAAPLAEGR